MPATTTPMSARMPPSNCHRSDQRLGDQRLADQRLADQRLGDGASPEASVIVDGFGVRVTWRP